MTNYYIVGSIAQDIVTIAFTVWEKLIGYCYKTLTVSPFDFGSSGKDKVGIISQLLSKSEATIIGVGTGLLLLVWVVGVLREGGNLISDRAHPYAIIAHIVRFFICEGLIAGYMFIVRSIFDLFTLATTAVIGKDATYGLVDPTSTTLQEFFKSCKALDASGLDAKAFLVTLFPTVGLADVLTGNTSLTDALLIDVLAIIYLIAVIACGIVIFMKVYGRYFRILVAIVVTPIGVAFFGSSHTEQNARKFLFYLLKQGAEGLVIALDLLIFNAISKGGSALIPDLVSAIANGMTSNPQVALILSFLISQIFFCVLLMTIVSASEKMVEQLL